MWYSENLFPAGPVPKPSPAIPRVDNLIPTDSRRTCCIHTGISGRWLLQGGLGWPGGRGASWLCVLRGLRLRLWGRRLSLRGLGASVGMAGFAVSICKEIHREWGLHLPAGCPEFRGVAHTRGTGTKGTRARRPQQEASPGEPRAPQHAPRPEFCSVLSLRCLRESACCPQPSHTHTFYVGLWCPHFGPALYFGALANGTQCSEAAVASKGPVPLTPVPTRQLIT